MVESNWVFDLVSFFGCNWKTDNLDFLDFLDFLGFLGQHSVNYPLKIEVPNETKIWCSLKSNEEKEIQKEQRRRALLRHPILFEV